MLHDPCDLAPVGTLHIDDPSRTKVRFAPNERTSPVRAALRADDLPLLALFRPDGTRAEACLSVQRVQLAIKASNDLASRGGNVAALRPRLQPQHLEANPDDPRLY